MITALYAVYKQYLVYGLYPNGHVGSPDAFLVSYHFLNPDDALSRFPQFRTLGEAHDYIDKQDTPHEYL